MKRLLEEADDLLKRAEDMKKKADAANAAPEKKPIGKGK